MVAEGQRKHNIDDAVNIFENFVAIVNHKNFSDFIWGKSKTERTQIVISFISWLRLIEGERVWFDLKYLDSALAYWKNFFKLAEAKEREYAIILKRYEILLKHRDELGEIGEFLADVVSSKLGFRCCLDFAMEHENAPS